MKIERETGSGKKPVGSTWKDELRPPHNRYLNAHRWCVQLPHGVVRCRTKREAEAWSVSLKPRVKP